MSRRRRVAAVTAPLVLTLATAWLVGQPSLRDRAFFTAAAAALRSNSVEVSRLDPPPATGPTTYLLVGSDRRHPPPGAVRDIRGERADAIILVTAGRTGAPVAVSLPRDLRVHVPGHGDGKLGGVLDYGPTVLVDQVRSLTHRPIHHYVEVEFEALSAAVDAVHGITIELPRSMRDSHTRLELAAGSHVLTGTEALAYVRARTVEELRAGSWVPDDSGDLGRIVREQQVLRLVAAKLSGCAALACLDVLRALGHGVTIDDALDADALAELVGQLTAHGAPFSTYVLPTVRERTAADSVSPFPPTHVGNVGYRRILEPAADVLLRYVLPTASERAALP